MTSRPDAGAPPTTGARGLRLEIVTIGDELLLGFTIDTNGAYLARALGAVGVEVVRRTSVLDHPRAIRAAVRGALDRTGAVITTGGLGPTADDRSKEAVGGVFGRELVLDQAHLDWMRERWRTRFGREMPASNVMQAMLPAGATKLENRHGSAPGVWIEDERGRWVAMLPGVPREMQGMTDDTLVPLLAARGALASVVRSRTVRTTGVAESLLGDQLRDVALPGAVSLAYLPSPDGVDLRLTVRHLSAANADGVLAESAALVRGAVGDAVYGADADDLAAIVLAACRARSLTVGLAESCTGGLLGARLTAIPGSSDVVLGGVIAYHNDVKIGLLGVDAAVLAREGAVSEPVVLAMAGGARSHLGASVGIGITGVAGPGGGTPDKPVGTVWIALDDGREPHARRLRLIGDRDEIRRRSAQAALDMLRRRLAGL